MQTANPRAEVLASHLQAAQLALAQKIKAEVDAGVPYFDSTRAVADDEITPFLNAMRSGGWIPKSRNGLLVNALQCEYCRRGSSRFAFEKDGTEVRCCVYCDH